MKKFKTSYLLYFLIFLVTGFLISCKEDEKVEPGNTHPATIKLKKVSHSGGSFREFTYNPNSQIIDIRGKDMYSLSGNFESESSVMYTNSGQVSEVITRGYYYTSKTKYFYNTRQKLISTQEYINDELQYYYTFQYDTKGRLIAKFTFGPETPEFKNFIPYLKREYEYDNRNNLSLMTEFNRGSEENWVQYMKYQYLDYDDKYTVDNLLSYPHFTPEIHLRKNNPGKEIRINYPGGETIITTHVYQYNAKHYPVKKTTTSSNNTSSETIFSYAE